MCEHRSVDCWELVGNADEAHALLVASDRGARGTGSPPQRNPATTQRLVRTGAVHGLRREGRLLVAVTLTEEPPFRPNAECTDVSPVLYMRRLSLDPDAQDTLLGFRAVKRAISHARRHGYRALRSEVNPDLSGVLRMLRSLGFRQCGEATFHGTVPAVQMELLLPQVGT